MQKIRGLVLSTVASVFAAASTGVLAQAAQQAIQRPTEEVLAQFPKMTGFQLSRDGTRMLAIESQGDTRNILVWQTADLSKKPTVIGSSSMQIASASFLKNDMLAVRLVQPYDSRLGEGVTKTFISKLLFTDLEGKVWKEPLDSSSSARSDVVSRISALSAPTVLNTLPDDPDHVLLVSDGVDNGGDVYRYNIRTAEATRIVRAGENDLGLVTDRAGVVMGRTRSGSDSKGVFIALDMRLSNSAPWEEHFKSYVSDRNQSTVVWVSSKSKKALLLSNEGREHAALYEYDIATKKIGAPFFEHQFFDANSVVLATEGQGDIEDILGVTYAGLAGDEVHWLDSKTEALRRSVAASLGAKLVRQEMRAATGDQKTDIEVHDGVSVQILQTRKADEPMHLIRVTGLAVPTEYYLLKGARLSLLAKSYPGVDKRALGTSKFVYYKARDGLNIPAFLTTPNPELCGAGPYAAVVHPHGGPWSRDSFTYDGSGWVPMLVSQCRAVLQPQFRGSAGWGRTLWKAGDREWGQKMQDDKDDGAKWLAEQKIADPKRIAMFGFSYGGYAAFAAAVRPNGLYKCSIAGAGVSDIDRIGSGLFSNPFFRSAQEPTMRGLSPLAKADKIEIPIMVYHGERDQIVPLSQSDLFVKSARKSSQPVEYHVLADYAHGNAWRRSTMTKQLQIISNYLATGCGGSGL